MPDVQHIANHHAAMIMFPQTITAPDGKIKHVEPIKIDPHKSVPVPLPLWKALEPHPAVQHLLSIGAIAKVKGPADVPIHTDSTANPEIPEHLMEPEEIIKSGQSAAGDISVGMKKTETVSAVKVDLVSK